MSDLTAAQGMPLETASLDGKLPTMLPAVRHWGPPLLRAAAILHGYSAAALEAVDVVSLCSVDFAQRPQPRVHRSDLMYVHQATTVDTDSWNYVG